MHVLEDLQVGLLRTPTRQLELGESGQEEEKEVALLTVLKKA